MPLNFTCVHDKNSEFVGHNSGVDIGITVELSSRVVISDDDGDYGISLTKDEALELADAIIEKFRPKKNIYVKLEGDWCITNLAEDILRKVYNKSEGGRVIIQRA